MCPSISWASPPTQPVPSYTRVDSEIVWRASERFRVSLVGQNLLKDHHLEADGAGQPIVDLIKRSGYVKFTWQF